MTLMLLTDLQNDGVGSGQHVLAPVGIGWGGLKLGICNYQNLSFTRLVPGLERPQTAGGKRSWGSSDIPSCLSLALPRDLLHVAALGELDFLEVSGLESMHLGAVCSAK